MSEPQAETVLTQEQVFKGPLIQVEHWQVRIPDGRTALREVVKHNGGAAIVALTDTLQVTLVRQYRVAMGRAMLELPAGKRDTPDEDPAACARRELEEETGLVAKEFRLLTVMDPSPGYLTERIHIYLATGLGLGERHPDDDEYITLVTMPLEEAVRLITLGEITDAKTICGLLIAARAFPKQAEGADQI